MKTDIVIIGSGIGGMTAASALAQIGRKVVVLEKSRDFGGLTTSFRRHRWEFNTGLHMHMWPAKQKDRYQRLWEVLGGAGMTWKESSVRYGRPGYEWSMPTRPDQLREELHAKFPSEAGRIDKYLDDMRSIYHDFDSYCVTSCVAGNKIGSFVHRIAGAGIRKQESQTVGEYFDKAGFSEDLRNHLAFFWDNYGLSPSAGGFVPHCLMAQCFINGCFLPDAPASTIAKGFRARIEAAGGEIATSEGVEHVVVAGGKARGVVTSRGRTIEAETIISCCGAEASYGLLPEEHRAPSLEIPVSQVSFVQLHAGLKPDAAGSYPLEPGCYWYFGGDRTDVDLWDPEATGFRPPYLNVQFLDSGALSIMVAASWRPFERWESTRVCRRGDDYDAFMERCVQGMLEMVEERFPGIGSRIEFIDSASPLTIRDYTSHDGGRCYGVGPSPGRYSTRHLQPATSLRGFYLGGQDVCNPGVLGGFIGGMMAAVASCKRDLVSDVLRMNGVKP